MAEQAHMHADIHHLGRAPAFVIQQVEALFQIVEKILARAEIRGAELHIVVGECIGNDELRAPLKRAMETSQTTTGG